jgi:DNA-binding response OmpR family regulator
LLKYAEYAVTHAETKFAAIGWLSRRPYQAMIVDCSVPKNHELQIQAELQGVPVIVIARQKGENTGSGITAVGLTELLTSVFKIAPLDWTRPKNKQLQAAE